MVDLGRASGYLSRPSGPAAAGIVVVHEWWGLDDHIRHWTDRLAGEGFAALAVDVYDGRTATDADAAMALMKAVDRDAAVRKLRAGLAFLAEDPRVGVRRRAAIGWCFGGGLALELAMAADDLDAAVVYYGPLVTDPDRLRNIRARLLGIFGTRDEAVPPETVSAFERAAAQAGVALRIERYDAPHAFANPSGPRYDEAAAEDAWNRARSFLRAALAPR
jgi:carboxymethylenebutenolidase